MRIFVSAGAPSATAGRKARRATRRNGHLGLGHVGERRRHLHRGSRGEGDRHRRLPLPGMECLRRRSPPATASGSARRVNSRLRSCSTSSRLHEASGLAQVDADGWFDTGDIAWTPTATSASPAAPRFIIIRGGENIRSSGRGTCCSSTLGRHRRHRRLPRRPPRLVRLRLRHPRGATALNFEEMVAWKEQKMAVRTSRTARVVEDVPRTPLGQDQKFKLRDAWPGLGLGRPVFLKPIADRRNQEFFMDYQDILCEVRPGACPHHHQPADKLQRLPRRDRRADPRLPDGGLGSLDLGNRADRRQRQGSAPAATSPRPRTTASTATAAPSACRSTVTEPHPRRVRSR